MSEHKLFEPDIIDNTIDHLDFSYRDRMEDMVKEITWKIERESIIAPIDGGPLMSIGGQTITMSYTTVANGHILKEGKEYLHRRLLTTDLSTAAQHDMLLDEMDRFIGTCVGLRENDDQGLVWRERPKLMRILTEKGLVMVLRARLTWR